MTSIIDFNKLPTIASSEAKNGFAALLERVQYRAETVVITRSAKPAAVVLSVNEYARLLDAAPNPLKALEAHFDDMVARMQTPAAKAGVDALFAASPEDLSTAVVRDAKSGR
ncbi:MAG: type II toxin-antitoxin system Phd/YefM family antitoxin [Rhodanobacter sp.]